MKLKILPVIYLLAAAAAGKATGAPENVENTSDGLVIHLNAVEVELAPANANTFRLSISLDGPPQAAPSIFLANTNSGNTAPWQEVREHGMWGIRTAAGELLMNPKNGEWALKDATGKILIPRQKIVGFQTTNGDSSVQTTFGWSKRPICVYGGGNGTNSLQQSHATTGLGNGRATIPYYWSETGYSVLAVTADDNRPARWSPSGDGKSLTWIFPGHTADLYLTPAATLKDAAGDYARLTGYAPVPPLWAFGYLQSRWGWVNRAYIENTLKKFEDLKIPVDAFIYDFEWYTKEPDYALPAKGLPDFEDFGWNTNLFPNPAEQIKSYQEQGVHFVGIRKPRMGNSRVLAMVRAKGWNAFPADDPDRVTAREVRFDDPGFREWYIEQSAPLLEDGVDGWWNDEGESRFTLYFYWNTAEREAFDRYEPGKRFWTLNRAFSPGLQRLGTAAWTGDIKSSWGALAATPTSLLNWSLAGMPYGACDIGGFTSTPTPELLSRWMEAGVFFPVMRTHSVIDATPHFPWLFGDDALNAIRKAIDLRYRLIPYYYSLAHQTFETGLPLMRPLVMEFPHDAQVANMSDEWMMGSSLLAAPILTPIGKRTVYFPVDTWYPFESNVPIKGKRTIQVTVGLDGIPLYVRAGTILPLAPPILHTSQLPGGTLDLQIYPGRDATFTLTEDDGETTNYLSGQTRRTTFQWNDATGQLTWIISGDYDGTNVFKSFHVTVFNPHGKLEGSGMLNSNGSMMMAAGVR